MPYDPNEDDEIKHGTLVQWAKYQVYVLGGHARGWQLVAGLVVVAFLAGLAL
jgi:hypothetical protein